MKMMNSFLLACILLTCSVWTVHGKVLNLRIDDAEADEYEVESSVDQIKLPGLCWTCKWALNKVKESAGRNSTFAVLVAKVTSICDKAGFCKSLCVKFINKNVGVLVEELSTTDDVRTICVNLKACKPKEHLDLSY